MLHVKHLGFLQLYKANRKIQDYPTAGHSSQKGEIMDDVQLKDLFILQGVGFFTRISVSLEKMRADGELSLDQFEKIIDFVKKAVRDMPDFYKFLDDLSEPDQLSADKIRKAIQRGTVKGVLTTLTQ